MNDIKNFGRRNALKSTMAKGKVTVAPGKQMNFLENAENLLAAKNENITIQQVAESMFGPIGKKEKTAIKPKNTHNTQSPKNILFDSLINF